MRKLNRKTLTAMLLVLFALSILVLTTPPVDEGAQKPTVAEKGVDEVVVVHYGNGEAAGSPTLFATPVGQ